MHILRCHYSLVHPDFFSFWCSSNSEFWMNLMRIFGYQFFDHRRSGCVIAIATPRPFNKKLLNGQSCTCIEFTTTDTCLHTRQKSDYGSIKSSVRLTNFWISSADPIDSFIIFFSLFFPMIFVSMDMAIQIAPLFDRRVNNRSMKERNME